MIVLSHAEQRDRLRRTCPQAVPNTLLAGDICYDRLLASRPLRPTYRRAFGLTAGQQLIVISSTWGRDSLIAADPELPCRVASALPADEFRVLLTLHPNTRAHHSRWQVAEYLSSARRAGVHVSHDVDFWRTGVVAADLLIGDHGSVPFYSAALGNPLLLASAPTHAVDPDSPSAQLLSAAPHLDLSADILDQVRRAIADHHPDRYAAIGALATSTPGNGAELLRAAMYSAMKLPEPDHAADIAVLPLPTDPLIGADAHVVHVDAHADRAATITRFPAERMRTGESAGPNTHLAVGVQEPQRRWLELADLIIGSPGPDTESWITDTLAQLPGCALAAAPTSRGDWLLGNQDQQLRVESAELPSRLFASLAYHLVSRDHTIDDLIGDWTIQCAGHSYQVAVTKIPPAR
ncbi:hypothetical protein OG203_37965 [Nocardia sp. NBC_01499]|uniref:hypothetical protein n=1 Tax=Nocardia sp. NBC_01499 TaxID=2903597 RepID=UPI003865653F